MRTPRSSAVAIAVTAFIVAGCGGSGSSTTASSTSGPATTAAASNTVVLKNISFSPDTLSIKTGDTVTWVWKDGAIPHNVDGKSSLSGLFSGSPQTSGTYEYTFTTSGTFHITCDIHPTMTLTVTVS